MDVVWEAMVITEPSCFALGTALQGITRIIFLLVMALQALSPPPCAEVEALNLGHQRNAALTNGGKMALTITLLRWANVLDLRWLERQLLARVQCP